MSNALVQSSFVPLAGITVVTAATYLVLALVSLRHGLLETYRKLWVAFCLVGAVHLMTIAGAAYSPGEGSAGSLMRLAFFLSCVVQMLLLFFTTHFCLAGRARSILNLLCLGWGGCLAILIPATDWILAGITLSEYSRFAPMPGVLAPAYFLFVVFTWVAAMGAMALAFRRSQGRERIQFGYTLLAFAFGLVGTAGFSLGFTLERHTVAVFLPALLLPLFPLTITVAIVRHRLWGIETILHRTAAWLTLSLMLVVPIGLVLWAGAKWLPPLPPVELAVVLSLLFLLGFVYLRAVKPAVDHRFQRRELDRRRTLERFEREMASLRRPAEVIAQLCETLTRTLYPKFCLVEVLARDEHPPAWQRWPDRADWVAPAPCDPCQAFFVWLASQAKAVEVDQRLPAQADPDAERDAAFAARSARVVVPLVQAERLIGLLWLAERANLKNYSGEELDFLDQIAAAASVGLSNALLFEQVDAQRRDLAELSADLEKRVEQRTDELSQANARLRDLDRIKNQFFANISHELRTPLSLVLSPLESILEAQAGDLSDGLGAQLVGVHRNALVLLKLIDDLLDLSKLEDTRMRLRLSRFDLASLATRIVDTAGPLADRKQIDLSLRIDDRAQIEADEEKIERVLINLIGNALKFTDPGRRIEVRVGQVAEHAWVAVVDEGIGIPENQLGAIFERFHQVDASITRRMGGSGIGLALARELTELHAGRIEVESSLGAGATFTVHLPISAAGLDPGRIERRVEEVQGDRRRREDDRGLPEWGDRIRASQAYRFLGIEQATERRLVPRQDPGGAKSARLLVVDDNPDVLQYLAQVLGGRYEVWHAQAGARALEMLVAQRHDLVVSDVMMPGMSGLELCRRIKSDPRIQDTPVILLTARAGEQPRIEGHWVGADQYLTKPFRPAELLAAIESLLIGRVRRGEVAANRRAASLETLLAGLAHELRNACHQARNAQVAMGELVDGILAGQGLPAADQRVEQMQAISRRALDRIAAVVLSLQQYASRNMQVPWTEVNLGDLIRKETSQLTLADQKGVRIELVLATGSRLRGPQEALRQMIINLVENAIQACEPGGRVRVETRHSTGTLVLEVADDGCGIAPADLERIFDLFFSTKSTGQGIGLGLALVKKTVDDLGGSIRVESRPGQGARFTVTLPRIEGETEPRELSNSSG